RPAGCAAPPSAAACARAARRSPVRWSIRDARARRARAWHPSSAAARRRLRAGEEPWRDSKRGGRLRILANRPVRRVSTDRPGKGPCPRRGEGPGCATCRATGSCASYPSASWWPSRPAYRSASSTSYAIFPWSLPACSRRCSRWSRTRRAAKAAPPWSRGSACWAPAGPPWWTSSRAELRSRAAASRRWWTSWEPTGRTRRVRRWRSPRGEARWISSLSPLVWDGDRETPRTRRGFQRLRRRRLLFASDASYSGGLRECRHRRLVAAIDRLRMLAHDDVVHFLVAARRHVQHEQHASVLQLLLEMAQARVGHLQADHGRHPHAEHRPDDRGDEHRHHLERDAMRRVVHEHGADQRAEDASDHEAHEGAVDRVGLVEIGRLVELAQVGAAAGEEAHVAIFDAREEQVVRDAARAGHVGERDVHSSHGTLLSNPDRKERCRESQAARGIA